MTGLERTGETLRKRLFRWSLIPTSIAIIVVLATAFYTDQQNTLVHTQNQHVNIVSQVSLIRSQLEGNINSDLQLVRGLVSVIAVEPDMSEEHFHHLASEIYAGQNQLRNIAAAPDLVITMVHPLEGNRGALGLNYNENEAQRRVAHLARDTGEVILAGPVDLVQGGQGFIGRFPVFADAPEGGRTFWGLVSAVVDSNALLQASGIGPDTELAVALVGKDGGGAQGELFYGDAAILTDDPVTASINLPSGSWQIYATPVGGWSTTPGNQLAFRLMLLVAALLVIVPVFVMANLYEERSKNRKQLLVISRRFQLALRASMVGVWELNITSGELHWDARMREIYGVGSSEQISVSDWKNGLHPEDAERAALDFESALAGRHQYQSSFRVKRPNGDVQHIRTIGDRYADPDGSIRFIGVNWDVTDDVVLADQLRSANQFKEERNKELELAKARIEKIAMHDALTSLPNRRYLNEFLSKLSEEKDGIFGILHIDLDRFKQINDTLGHAAGDAVLVHTAEVLCSSVRKSDFVARIGGDEFVVVCLNGCSEQQLDRLASRIVTKMQEPILFEGRPCRSSVSIGLALSSSSQGDPHRLLINADIALYKAKNLGRNSHQLFSSELHRSAVKIKRVADEILTGIEQQQFTVHYQGQFDAASHDLVGVEALVRWEHPTEGLLNPGDFLDIAEELNVLPIIDEIVLKQALEQMQDWRQYGTSVPRVSVNVSARRLHDANLIEQLKTLAFEPGTLTFELVESTFLDQSDDQVAFNIDQIRELGIGLEIDDFGTAYASIVSLMKLRPSVLKIDRQLIMPITQSQHQRDLVRSIVEIGKSLDIAALAEGVETMEHANIARELGCTTVQGFAFAKPMSGDAFSIFMKNRVAQTTQQAV